MKKYNLYKDSGIDWLGEIPEHWCVKKLNYIGNFTSSGIDKKIIEEESLVKIINFTDVSKSKNHILSSDLDYMIVSAPDNKISKNLVEKGDLIFLPSSETKEDLGLSALVNENLKNTSFSYHVIRFQFNEGFVHSYKKYLTNNHTILNIFSSNGQGTTRQIIGRDVFKNIKVAYPPLEEQTQIANYLDQKTIQIDELIAKKEQLIQLLKEERKTIINHSVTKGINPNVPMKISHIQWLGKIPEHWDVKRTKYLFDIRKNIAGKLGYDVLSVTQKGIKIKDITSGDGQLSMDYSKYQLVKKGQFVMNHMDLLTGFVDKSKYEGVTSPDYRVFESISKESKSDYYLYLYQMFYNEKLLFPYGRGSAQVGRWRLPTIEFRNFRLPVPPIDEQEEIVAYIKTKHNEIDKALFILKKEIKYLNEYKSTLINEVVTGKIDIREEVLN